MCKTLAHLWFCLKFAFFVNNMRKLKGAENNLTKNSQRLILSLFTFIGSLGQKRAEIFNFAVFVQNSVRNYGFARYQRLLSKTCTQQQLDKIFPLFNVKLVQKRASNCKFT